VALADLGYLSLICANPAKAETYLREALDIVDADDMAILRVAYWRDVRVVPDDLQHPSQFISTRLAVQGNLVACYFAQDRPGEAEDLVQIMLSEQPQSPLGCMVQGWVRMVQGNYEAACMSWQEALNRSQNERERGIITKWLECFGQ
jgi:hypothetical protein